MEILIVTELLPNGKTSPKMATILSCLTMPLQMSDKVPQCGEKRNNNQGFAVLVSSLWLSRHLMDWIEGEPLGFSCPDLQTNSYGVRPLRVFNRWPAQNITTSFNGTARICWRYAAIP